MEVRAPWTDPTGDRTDSGQDYDALLAVADRLIMWDYFALNHRPATYTTALARAVTARAKNRFIMSIGLWATNGAISATDLQTALRASVTGGVTSVWVTPTSLLSPQLWDALSQAWTGAPPAR